VRSLALSLLVLGLLPACNDKPSGAAAQPESCESDSDCKDGWTCLAQACADPRSGGIYSDPTTAVTPDKVKKEIELRTQQHAADNEKSLEPE
jgi:hypothetical protein